MEFCVKALHSCFNLSGEMVFVELTMNLDEKIHVYYQVSSESIALEISSNKFIKIV